MSPSAPKAAITASAGICLAPCGTSSEKSGPSWSETWPDLLHSRETSPGHGARGLAKRTDLVFSKAGMRGVALQGGAEMLAAPYPDPGFRFLSDLGILLSEDDLERAVPGPTKRASMSERQVRLELFKKPNGQHSGFTHRQPAVLFATTNDACEDVIKAR